MPLFDLPLDRLRSHRSAVTAPDDLAAFWADTLARARTNDLDLRLVPEDAGLTVFDVDDVTFNGFAGAPIKAWYQRPRGAPDCCRAWSSSSATAADEDCPPSG